MKTENNEQKVFVSTCRACGHETVNPRPINYCELCAYPADKKKGRSVVLNGTEETEA